MRPMLYLVQKLFVTTQIFVKQHNHKTQKYGITEIDTVVFCLLLSQQKVKSKLNKCDGLWLYVVEAVAWLRRESQQWIWNWFLLRRETLLLPRCCVLVGGGAGDTSHDAAHCSHHISAE